VLSTWRRLPHERRLAAGAALGLFATLFLPWYQDTAVVARGAAASSGLQSFSTSVTGWGGFSFVEAAVLLVAAGVLTLLYIRADGGAFHVPGGDGGVIVAAGVWTCVLVIWRIFDKEGSQSAHTQYVTSSGVEWGIFVALGVAGLLAYAGTRIRLAHEPEPPLPGEAPSRPRPRRPVPAPAAAAAAWGVELPGAERAAPQEPPTQRALPHEPPTQRALPDEPPTRALPPDAEPPTARDQRRRRPIEFPDLDEIEFQDPPTARLGRSAPAGRRPPPPPDGE
jgi:hypothetical protein